MAWKREKSKWCNRPHNTNVCSGTASSVPGVPQHSTTRPEHHPAEHKTWIIHHSKLNINFLEMECKKQWAAGHLCLTWKATKHWDLRRQHPRFHRSAPERNMWFSYMGKHSFKFHVLFKEQRDYKVVDEALKNIFQGTEKTEDEDPSLFPRLMPTGNCSSPSSSSQKKGWKRPVSCIIKKWQVKTNKASKLTGQSRRNIIPGKADFYMRGKKVILSRSYRAVLQEIIKDSNWCQMVPTLCVT